VRAIVETARLVERTGFESFKQSVLASPMESLKMIPFIGEVTAFHLAKNLGFPAAKPDRHLQRLASVLGYSGAAGLCRDLSDRSGDSIQVVDSVLWRFTERNGYRQVIAQLNHSH
jgi:hypothetical protein